MTTWRTYGRAVLLFVSQQGSAQEAAASPRDTVFEIQPITVTGTQAVERETPATFTNLTARQIRQRYSVQDVPVILSDLPSMTTYSENGNGIGYSYVNLRGFDQRRISVMVNGVPQNDPEEQNVYWIDFPDLLGSTNSVQVQRGAGSAFYGPPAIGGSINVVTNPFTREPGMSFETLFGFQQFADSSASFPLNTKKFSVSVNSGLVGGRHMFYARLSRILSDGYRTNSWVDLPSYFLGAMRLDENMTTRFDFYGGPLSDGLSYYGLPKFVNDNPVLRRQNLVDYAVDSSGGTYSSVTPRRPQEIENFSQPHYELINEWRLSPSVTLHTTLFYYTGDGFFDYDASWADTSMLRIGSRYGFPTTQNLANTLVRAFVGNSQWGWLPRVEIKHDRGTLTLGGEFRFHRSTHWGKIQYAENLPLNFDPDYHFYEFNGEKDILSFYGYELFRLRDNLNLMASLQLVHDRYGIRNEKYLENNFTHPYLFLNPKIGVTCNVTAALSTYLSLGYTSREPTLRNLYAAEDSYFGATPSFHVLPDTSGGVIRYDFSSPIARPEKLFDAELGARYDAPDLSLAGDLYWMEFADELVESGQVDIFGQPVTGNAQRTRHLGVEMEGSVRVIGDLWLGGNATLSLNRLIHDTVYTDGGRVALDGNPVAGFPDALGNLRLSYRGQALEGSLLLKFVGAFYTDNFRDAANRNDPYTVANAEVTWRLPETFGVQLSLRGEVHNLFNALYFLSGQGATFFPAAERSVLIGLAGTL